MVLFFIALFIGIPFVWHWFVYDRAEVSARSAFLLGVGCGTFSGLRESWQIGILVFFLAAFFAFAIAYLVGLIYAAFASAARSDYMDRVKADGLSERRSIIGAAGAIAIPMVVFAAWGAHGLQSGVWEQPSTRALLGYGAFLVLGVTAAMRIAINRRRQD